MTRVTRTTVLVLLLALASISPAGVAQTRNLVLVTLDGVRVQEMFGGLDVDVLRRGLEAGQRLEDAPAYKKYWASTREERRLRLMPFFWGTLMRSHGSIVGDRGSGRSNRLANAYRSSYPGYSEFLTGRAHDDVVTGNDLGQNPYPSVLEFLRRRLGVRRQEVAVFASWGTMARIAEHVPGTIFVNAGPDPYDAPDRVVDALNRLQLDTPTDSALVRRDAYTIELALAHLRLQRPRVLYASLDETDGLAHAGRYPEVLEALARIDRWLERLWAGLQTDGDYRDRTALVVTTDHGRGRMPDHWHQHGAGVEGAEDVWTAFVVPESSRRGVWRDGPPVTHDQLAATLARLMGLDYSLDHPASAPPLEAVFGDRLLSPPVQAPAPPFGFPPADSAVELPTTDPPLLRRPPVVTRLSHLAGTIRNSR
jgi:hypothetical protein